jgi:capsular exopolysaccharide synthesis family protein
MSVRREISFAGDLRFMVGVLWSAKLVIVGCVAAGLGLGLLYLHFTPRSYAAKTVIQVEQEDQKVVKIDDFRSEDRKSVEVLKTYEQNILSSEVLLRVIHHPSVAQDPAFLPEAKGRADNLLFEALSRHLDVRIRRGTRLIDIVVEDHNPELAQRVAGLVVDEFARWNFESRRQAGQLAGRFLLDEAERLKARLTKSEQALQSYKEQHEAVSLAEKQNITVSKLEQLNQRVTEAKAERLKLEADTTQLTRSKGLKAHELLAIPSIANAPAVLDLRKTIGEREAALATLGERYKSAHPRFIAAKTELEKLKTGLDEAVFRAADMLAAQYQAAQANEGKLEEALREQQKAALDFDKVSISYSVLQRDAESDRALYDSVLTRVKETDITKDIAQDPIRVVARPLLPARPSKPSKTLVLGLSLIAGFVGGCALGFATHAADRSLRSLQDAETRLGLRSLGEIPRLLPAGPKGEGSPLVADSDFAAAESFRTLRASLSLLSNDANRRTFLFTSAQQGEGKTFCAINCAVSFAQLGLRTLLVDADFRMPQLGRIFLKGDAAARSGAIQPTQVPNLSVLAPVDGAAAAAEALSGRNFEEFMQRAAAQFDRVVVDSAPVQLVSDTLVFARHVQSVCLVIRAGRTPAEDVLRAAQRLAEAGAPLVGFVWNQVKVRRGNYYQYGQAPADRSAGSEAPTLLAAIEAPRRAEVSTAASRGESSPPQRRS